MKVKKFNENWQENAFNRKTEYVNLLDDVLETYKEQSKKWENDDKWHYTAEMYDLLESLIENLERLDEDLSSEYMIKLENINEKQ